MTDNEVDELRRLLGARLRNRSLLPTEDLPWVLWRGCLLSLGALIVFLAVRGYAADGPRWLRQVLPEWLWWPPDDGSIGFAPILAGLVVGFTIAVLMARRSHRHHRDEELARLEAASGTLVAKQVFELLHPRDMRRELWDTVEDELDRAGDRFRRRM